MFSTLLTLFSYYPLTKYFYTTILDSSIKNKGCEKLSGINLIILGYLQHGEKSAYEMVKEFETWNLHHWLKISNPAIYKNIIKLCVDGYLNSRIVKEGEMPEKTIYSINDKGLSYFYDLMEYSSKHIGSIYFDFNSFLVNIEKLPENKRRQFLINLKEHISDCNRQMKSNYKMQLESNEKTDNVILLLDLYNDFYGLLERWSNKILKHYEIEN